MLHNFDLTGNYYSCCVMAEYIIIDCFVSLRNDVQIQNFFLSGPKDW